MSDARKDQVKRLLEVVAGTGPEHRRALLDGLEPSLRGEVAALLAARTGAGSLEETFTGEDGSETVAKGTGPGASRPTRTAPDRIGPYRILREIGEGGMGIVYEAEQQEPVRRRVALKLIKWGMDTKAVMARFESERQALALMNHPSIASVYDAGATKEGRPYFAMEYVPGIPITTYCDKQRMTIRERLRLFIEVCQGVQHAHQKGIIHRDVKPSNVLVAVQDDRPVPKIIDFGVAKATSQRLTELTVATEMGQLIGTPEYMSPEQAEMTNLDIDTRTDVYSLGVLLYELLVGAQPFELQDLRGSGLLELHRKLREEEPPRPSTRVSGLGEASMTLASNRAVEVKTLQRQLRGDLDWITMKALEKDRTRRYETANALALDVERYLESEPIRARAPSTFYRLGRFVGRHRAAAAAAVTVTLALFVGLLLATTGLIRARRAERTAASEAKAAREVADFLVDLFQVSEPEQARGETITAREILDEGAERISGLTDQPLTQARLMDAMGRVYKSLGLYGESRPLLEEALRRRETALGDDHPDVASSLDKLADLESELGEYAKAEPLYERALAVWRAFPEADELEVARTLNDLAALHRQQGKYEQAEPLHLEALAIQEKLRGPNDTEVATTLRNLAILYRRQGDFARAERYFERSLAIREEILESDHPDVARSLNSLAILHIQQDKFEKAEPLLKRSLDIKEQAQGPEHPDVANSLDNLAILYARQKRFADAEPLFERALAIREKAYGRMHPDVAQSLHNVAGLLGDQGRWEEAEGYYRRSLAVSQELLGPSHPNVVDTVEELAKCLRELGESGEAAELLARMERIRRQ